jgi:hypothetical protein
MIKKVLVFLSCIGCFGSAHAVWDVTTPAGTESKSLGDDRIRELKTDIQTALEHEGEFPGEDTSSPKFIYTPSSGTSAQRPSGLTNTATGQLYINTSSSTIERFDGLLWSPVASLIPTGFKTLIVGNSCPPGWAVDTSSGGRALRVSESLALGGIDGGSSDISTTTYAHSHTVDAHTHTTPDHQHNIGAQGSASYTASGGTHLVVDGAGEIVTSGGAGTSPAVQRLTESGEGGGTSGSTSPGTNNALGGILKYLNVLVCTAP